MDFSDDQYTTLINLYKARPIPWDPSNPKYKLTNYDFFIRFYDHETSTFH
jgi:hypothetical protein